VTRPPAESSPGTRWPDGGGGRGRSGLTLTPCPPVYPDAGRLRSPLLRPLPAPFDPWGALGFLRSGKTAGTGAASRVAGSSTRTLTRWRVSRDAPRTRHGRPRPLDLPASFPAASQLRTVASLTPSRSATSDAEYHARGSIASPIMRPPPDRPSSVRAGPASVHRPARDSVSDLLRCPVKCIPAGERQARRAGASGCERDWSPECGPSSTRRRRSLRRRGERRNRHQPWRAFRAAVRSVRPATSACCSPPTWPAGSRGAARTGSGRAAVGRCTDSRCRWRGGPHFPGPRYSITNTRASYALKGGGGRSLS
jgi:hypothetical protein